MDAEDIYMEDTNEEYPGAILDDRSLEEIQGLEEAREYLRTEALIKPTEMFVLRCKSTDDRDFMSDKTGTRLFLNCSGVWKLVSPNTLDLVTKPVFLALLLEEYDTAEKLVDAIGVLSLGSIGRGDARGEECCRSILTVEKLLYLPDCKIPEKLRDKILSRLEEEGDDLYDWSTPGEAIYGDKEVRKKFVSDVRKYPKLFVQSSKLYYAGNLETLNIMLTLLPSDDCVNSLLAQKSEEMWEHHPWVISEDLDPVNRKKIQKKILELSQIVKTLENRRNTHTNLYTLLIFFISFLREDEVISGEERLVWKMMDALPFEEKDFKALVNNEKLRGSIDVLYELAFRKLGKRQPLGGPKCSIYTLMEILGMNYQGGPEPSPEEEKERVMNLFQYVSNIEYPDYLAPGNRRKYLSGIMTENADEMKDIFADLLRKGFVPMEDLEYVMKWIEDKKECEYMRPFLILQKFGGLPKEDGEKPPGGKTG